ncbi:MAG: hypothetical protein Q7U53_05205 [Anaerolineaceae bacterium]|nr:hypothetical protein [Anaerolineaceae bacterium]
MYYDNVFLYFFQRNNFQNNFIEKIISGLSISQSAIDEIHFLTLLPDAVVIDNLSLHSVHTWHLSNTQQFILISLLFDRVACQEKNILIIQKHEQFIYSILVGSGKLVGKYNVLPLFSLDFSDSVIKNVSQSNNSQTQDLNNFIIADGSIEKAEDNQYFSNKPFLFLLNLGFQKKYKSISFQCYTNKLVYSLQFKKV